MATKLNKPAAKLSTPDLAAQIAALTHQLAQQSQLEDPNLWANTMHAEGVKRVILIAALGGHTVLFIGPEAARAVTLAAQLGVASQAITFPTNSALTPKQLAAIPFAKFDIHCEAPATPSAKQHRATSLAEVQERLNDARANQPKCKPGDMQFNESANILMRHASGKLGFNLMQRETITTVARTIARFDGKSLVDSAHAAEAINYCLDRRI